MYLYFGNSYVGVTCYWYLKLLGISILSILNVEYLTFGFFNFKHSDMYPQTHNNNGVEL